MNKVVFTTSWDDGDILDLKLVKLMNRYGIKGTFYIPGNTKLSNKQIIIINKTQEIGAHTMNHYELDTLDLNELQFEVRESKKFLENIVKKKIETFCYPRGKYNAKVVSVVKKAGFKYARTTNRFEFKLNKNSLLNGASAQTITFKIDIFKFLRINNFNPFSIKYIWDWNYYMESLYACISKKGGLLHLWGHSWEIEKYNQWDQLESFFSFISKKKNVEFVVNGGLVKK